MVLIMFWGLHSTSCSGRAEVLISKRFANMGIRTFYMSILNYLSMYLCCFFPDFLVEHEYLMVNHASVKVSDEELTNLRTKLVDQIAEQRALAQTELSQVMAKAQLEHAGIMAVALQAERTQSAIVHV